MKTEKPDGSSRGSLAGMLLLIGCALVFVHAGTGLAETAAARPPSRPAERGGPPCVSGVAGRPMSERAQKQLLAAIEAIDGDRLDEALERLDRISSRGLGPFGQGLAFQLRAGIAANRGDIEGAARFMQQSIDSGGYCGERLEAARLQLAQLQMALERWDDSIALLESVVESSAVPNAEAWYRIALAQYRAGRLESALAAAEKAIALVGGEAKEPWQLLLLQIHWDRKALDACLPILRELALAHPKRDYWMRLGFVLYELGRPEEALVALQLGDLANLLDAKDDQLRLVQLEMFEDIPARAAERLQKAIESGAVPADQKSLEVLSNTWLAARDRERAIDPLLRAAELAPDGRDWLRAAQIRAQLDDWVGAESATKEALEKGSLEDPGMAYLLLGMAHFNQKQFDAARIAFEKALPFEKARAFATTWLAAIRGASPSAPVAAPPADRGGRDESDSSAPPSPHASSYAPVPDQGVATGSSTISTSTPNHFGAFGRSSV